MELTDLVILSLATFRATRLLVRDQILARFRMRAWAHFPPDERRIGYLLTCEWCMSIWVGSAFVLWSILSPTVFMVVGLALSASAIAGLLTAYEDR